MSDLIQLSSKVLIFQEEIHVVQLSEGSQSPKTAYTRRGDSYGGRII